MANPSMTVKVRVNLILLGVTTSPTFRRWVGLKLLKLASIVLESKIKIDAKVV